MKKVLLLLVASILLSCTDNTNPEEIASDFLLKFLNDSVTTISDYSVITFEADSFYLPVFRTSTHIEARFRLSDYYSDAKNEVRDYEYQRKVFGDTPINGGLVDLYQGYVRDGIRELKDIEESYKPSYVGVRVPVAVKYSTSFKDSIIIADVILKDNLKEVVSYEWVLTSASIDDMASYYGELNDENLKNMIIEARSFENSLIADIDTSFFITPIILE